MSASLSAFSKKLRELPTTMAQKVAARAANEITELARSTFSQSEDAFGIPWLPGFDGRDVTLRKSGTLANTIRYVATGTKLRIALGVSYAKYQIGKRPIFPTQGGLLPPAYSRALEKAAQDVGREALT